MPRGAGHNVDKEYKEERGRKIVELRDVQGLQWQHIGMRFGLSARGAVTAYEAAKGIKKCSKKKLQ
jgi:hypothetical protein